MAQLATGTEGLKEAVREHYAAAARASLDLAGGSCCGSSCCADDRVDPVSANLYDAGDAVFEGALSASLGCGNPTALIDLEPGQDVLDLGSGGGLDVLLSARRVAPDGIAYGVDMTDEMLQLALRNKRGSGLTNAVFVKGSIEDIPLPDSSVDVVISNCVINLSTNKPAVLREAFRVLRPGGRFAVSDIVLTRALETGWSNLVGLWTGCISGALLDEEYVRLLTAAGFTDPSIQVTRAYDSGDLADLADQLPESALPAGATVKQAIEALEGAFVSAFIRAEKPRD